jgi:hypothetical protein
MCGYDEPPRTLEKWSTSKNDKEKDKGKGKKPLSKINLKPITGAFEL